MLLSTIPPRSQRPCPSALLAYCCLHRSVLQVKVKRRGSDQKYVARVLAMGVECDIALLTVEEEEFWEGLEPVAFGALPHLQDSVTVVGCVCVCVCVVAMGW